MPGMHLLGCLCLHGSTYAINGTLCENVNSNLSNTVITEHRTSEKRTRHLTESLQPNKISNVSFEHDHQACSMQIG